MVPGNIMSKHYLFLGDASFNKGVQNGLALHLFVQITSCLNEALQVIHMAIKIAFILTPQCVVQL